MLEIICTKGIPCSGKTTWAKDFLTNNQDFVCINRNTLMVMLNNRTIKEDELTSKLRDNFIREALLFNKSVIVDECNVTSTTFKSVCRVVEQLNIDCTVKEKMFYVDLGEAIKRDQLRDKEEHLGANIVKSYWESSKGANMLHYKANELTFIKEKEDLFDPNKKSALPKAILCDIDGTIALFNSSKDVEPRYASTHTRAAHLLTTSEKDSPNMFLIDLLHMYHDNGYKIIFSVGRQESSRETTENFLNKHLTFTDWDLHMRAQKDFRRDFVLKREVYCEKIKNKYNVCVVFEDKQSVVESYRRLGLSVYQVN